MVIASVNYSGQPGDDSELGDWLVLEQAHIPHAQQFCTVADLRGMLEQAMLGRSALSYVSDKCPVSKRIGPGGSVIASYNATIFVHRSSALAGKYDLIPSEGSLSECQTTMRERVDKYHFNYEVFKLLGWLPAASVEYKWLTKVYDQDHNRVFDSVYPVSSDGYIFFDQGYQGHLQVSGTALVDRYVLTIEHQLGFKFDKTVLLTAEWGPADENGDREAAVLEVEIPGHVIAEFEKCSSDIFALHGTLNDGSNIAEDVGGYGGSTMGKARKRKYIGRCTGDVLKTETII